MSDDAQQQQRRQQLTFGTTPPEVVTSWLYGVLSEWVWSHQSASGPNIGVALPTDGLTIFYDDSAFRITAHHDGEIERLMRKAGEGTQP